MELDDLKEKWKSTNVQSSSDEIRLALENRVHAVRRSGRGIRRVFFIEMAIVLVMYLGVLAMMLWMGERVMSYMYKIIAVTGIGSIPPIIKLYKAQRWINSMDYSNDMRSNMIAFVEYYKSALRMYQWSTYIVVALLLILLVTDGDFMSLPMKLRLTAFGYMAFAVLLAAPYIRAVYGRKTTIFETFLRD